jgi:DNA-directed RNA polymerase subunit E"
MKACRNCRMIVYTPEKSCPKCSGELSDKFSGMIIILDPESSEIAKEASLNAAGSYAVKVK